jgi:hypothetical protein
VKKFISILLVLTMIMAFAVGCSKPAEENEDPVVDGEQTEETPDESEETPDDAEAGEVVKLGLGNLISIDRSKDAGTDEEGKAVTASAQADVTMAAVGFDSEGKVASVTVDVVQAKVPFDEDLKVTANRDEEVKSKKDLGPDYGMKTVSEKTGIGKEWDEQMASFEEWMIGKTVDEITGLKVKERDPSHQNVPDVPELTSTVTITVESYIAAVEEAWEKAVDVEVGERVGLGVKASIAKSKDYNPDQDGKEVLPVAQADVTMSAIALNSDDQVVGSIVDTAQVKVNFDKDGKITNDREAELKTKHELKEDYGMKTVSEKIGIGKEWYEQMNSFQEWMIGKTKDEITSLPTKEKDEAHPTVPDTPELASTVTIDVGTYIEATEEAIDNAR